MEKAALRVCLLTASISGLGGVEAVVRQLAEDLSRRGHRVLVLTLDRDVSAEYPGDSAYEVSCAWSRTSDRYQARTTRGGSYKAWWQLRSLSNRELMQKVEAIVTGFQPDVVHTHKVRGFPRKLWPRLGELGAFPIMHTCHDIELLSPDHRISVVHPGLLNGLLLKAYGSLAKLPSSSVSTVSSPSEFMLALHQDRDLFPGASARVIPNAPDLEPTGTERLRAGPGPGEALKLLFIGRLVEVKGIRALCEATTMAVNDGLNIELVIAGDGDLRHVAERYDASHDFVRFLGPVTGADKERLFRDCHVVVVPSQYDETFGIVAAEAITAARPVLVSSRGGLPEVVDDGETGWVYRGDGVNALLEGLKQVDACREQLSAFSAQCEAISGRFARQSVIDCYESSYERLLAGGAGEAGG